VVSNGPWSAATRGSIKGFMPIAAVAIIAPAGIAADRLIHRTLEA
jgi:hypothetical protein